MLTTGSRRAPPRDCGCDLANRNGADGSFEKGIHGVDQNQGENEDERRRELTCKLEVGLLLNSPGS
jgi:hypothetical protein